MFYKASDNSLKRMHRSFSIAGIDIEERVPDQYIYKYPVQDNYHVNHLNVGTNFNFLLDRFLPLYFLFSFRVPIHCLMITHVSVIIVKFNVKQNFLPLFFPLYLKSNKMTKNSFQKSRSL